MRLNRTSALLGTCVVASLTVVTANLAVPQLVRVALGIPIVFILPGFAIVSVLLPARELSRGERLLAALAISLVTSICVAVLLGAMPVGLSRTSFSFVLGGITITASMFAWFRVRFDRNKQRRSESGPQQIGY